MPIRTIGGVFASSSEFDLLLTIIIIIFAALDFGVPVATASVIEGALIPV